MDGLPEWTPVMEPAFVNRLKELNVVFAETTRGSVDQVGRMTEGSPAPEARIEGALGSLDP